MGAEYFSLASGEFKQDWSNTGLITVNDDWSGVQSIVGFLGDYTSASPTGVNPGTLTAAAMTSVDVIANQTSPNSNTSGGVAEFELANPTIALQGSGTADAPNLVIHLDATGRENITISYNLRDLDGSGDNAVQQVALQYRTSPDGPWIDVPAGYVADATSGPNLATQVTAVTAVLPAGANNAATLQVRIITTNAAGNDEWVGIDDIVVASAPLTPGTPGDLSIFDASVTEGNSGTAAISFTVTREGGSSGAISASYTIGFPGSANAADLAAGTALTGTVSFADGETSKTITVQVAGDTAFEPNETFTVTLSGPTGGAGLIDAQATGTILNDDAAPTFGSAFINEIHYDNSGADAGEAIEIAAPAGTSLAGWSLVFYNGTDGRSYATVALSGTVPNQDDGYGTLSFAGPTGGIQNGAPDGVALVNAAGQVIQFLSYEGSFTAANGPAAGMVSTDIGVAEEPAPGAGLSLQLVGSGSSYGDFTWVSAADDNFGAVNGGQNFIGDNANGQVSVRDASVVEGDAGVQQLVFTVRRAGGSAGSGTVDYTINLDGTANAADIAAGTRLSGTISFAPGESSRTIVIDVVGDTVGEGNETLNVRLSNPTGAIEIVDGDAVGRIVNDDPIALAIHQIQGESHSSAYVGQRVITQGIVTAVDTNGFYLQDATGDGNARTSDAVFVLTGTAPTVSVGDAIELRGTVAEFRPGNDPNNLTVTQISAEAITTRSTGNALPAAVLIGAGGVLPPSDIIDDDGFATYDPESDGIDFYESLEGMRVTIEAPLVVSQSSDFGETFVVASGGIGATGVNARGGITISDGDFNPERIQIDNDSGLFAGYMPNHTQGDRLGNVTGVVSYSFESYEVLVTEAVTVTSDVTLGREVTTLDGDVDHLSFATYNLENLDPTDSVQKFDLLARDIVYNLSAPDIIAVQEIQDSNGLGGTDPLSGAYTAQLLIDAIAANGGPRYIYVEIAPATANSTGGEPGGNIRNGFFYNPDRVSLVEGGLALISGPAFNGSRQPLVGTFSFNGQEVTVINVHFTSRGGSDPLFGATQPPANAGEDKREAQGDAVRDYVDGLLATDPAANIIVAGDFNGFYFEDALESLEADGVLTNLHRTIAEAERYSYLFDGNLQALDNVFVSRGLLSGAKYDPVHINAEQTSTAFRGTDHDPQVATFFIPEPNDTPTDLVIDDADVGENAPAGTVVGTISASDADGDVLEYSLVNDAGGLFVIDEATGVLTTTGSFDHEALSGYTIVARATDGDGASTERTLTIAVTNLNEAPVAVADGVAVSEDATSDNLWNVLLGNDRDPDAGTTLSISAVDGSGTLGSLIFDPATQTLRYVADNDRFDALAPGETVVDRFTYTVTDAGGLTSTATVEVTVTGIADGVRRDGGNGNDALLGTGGEDVLSGGNGNDSLRGLDGHDELSGGNGEDLLFGGMGNDSLFGGNGNDDLFGGAGNDLLSGGNGNDRIVGGAGDDLLTGGNGSDSFVFGRNGGRDQIADFRTSQDRIVLEGGLEVAGSQVGDANGDGILDLSVVFSDGGSVTLFGVSDFAAVQFVRSNDPFVAENLF